MRRLFYIAILLIMLGASSSQGAVKPAPKRAQDAGSSIPKIPAVVTTYDLYVGGIHLLTADILFQEEASHYVTHLHAHTAGYLYEILKWDGDLSSKGKIKGDRFLPVSFRNLDTWRDKPKTTKLDFDAKGGVKAEFDPPNNDQNRDAVTDAEKKGALDPITALLQMLGHVASENSCTVSVPVFDGKRRFDLTGEDKGRELIDEEDYGVYKGPARLCNVDFKMIAGDWKDRAKNRFWERENGEQGRDTFHIWLASLEPALPELPVRLESTSAYGDIALHLTSWHYAKGNELLVP